MKLCLIGIILAAAITGGCSYNDRVDVELRTDAKGRLSKVRLIEPSQDEAFNAEALRAAKRRFPHRVPDPKPDMTYIQPVLVTYPLFPEAK